MKRKTITKTNRMTICIDVLTDEHVKIVQKYVDELEAKLGYEVAEYDPVYNFDTVWDTVDKDEEGDDV
jgi:hypothetical protein